MPQSDTIRPLVTLDVDRISTDELVAVADWEGPAVTLTIDSSRHGVIAPDGPRRAKSLIDRARRTLEHATVDGRTIPTTTIRELVTRLLALGGDPATWRHGADGTVIVATASHTGLWHTGPVDLDRVDVTAHPRIRRLLGLTRGVGPFTIVAISLDRVRILRGDDTHLEELPLGRTPRSIGAALWFQDEERRITQHSAGSGTEVMFHGHAAGGEQADLRTRQFLSLVHTGLVEVLGERNALAQPVIVAGVAEHLADLRRITSLPDLVAVPIAGNHTLVTDRELHRRAVGILAARHGDGDVLAHRARLAGTGLTIDAIEELPAAADHGRIDRLVVEAGVERWPADGALADEIVDRVIVATLRHGGEVVEVPTGTIGGPGVSALTRW
ncbi:MAG: hypothetical protein ACO35E_04825 [Ilumatobacteraceae bacterium]